MRTNEKDNGLRLSHNALPEMKARLALLNAAISALQCYQEQSHLEEVKKNTRNDASDAAFAGVARPKPFLIARRDDGRSEKAS